MEKERQIQEKIETTDFLKRLESLNKTRAAVMLSFFIFTSTFKWGLGIALPTGVIIGVLVLFLAILICRYFSKKAKTLARLENVYLGYFFLEILFLTFIVHYIGGAEWMGAIIYMFLIAQANIVLSRKKGFFVALTAGVSYSGLLLLEYFGIVPHCKFFIAGPNLYQNLSYVLLCILTAAFIMFLYVAYIIGTFSELLKKRTIELRVDQTRLAETQKELEEAKTVLEIKVQARTRELRALAASLEEQVQQRTEELQKKVKELEKFQKLSIGRELKMVELKKEIKKLKEELKKH